jgi:hypothetical protein
MILSLPIDRSINYLLVYVISMISSFLLSDNAFLTRRNYGFLLTFGELYCILASLRSDSMQNNSVLIGRKAEQEILRECLASKKSEFIALYGRRRVGKTLLVREVLGSDFVFYTSGILNGTGAEQIANFNLEIVNFGGSSLAPAGSWSKFTYRPLL